MMFEPVWIDERELDARREAWEDAWEQHDRMLDDRDRFAPLPYKTVEAFGEDPYPLSEAA